MCLGRSAALRHRDRLPEPANAAASRCDTVNFYILRLDTEKFTIN